MTNQTVRVGLYFTGRRIRKIFSFFYFCSAFGNRVFANIHYLKNRIIFILQIIIFIVEKLTYVKLFNVRKLYFKVQITFIGAIC